MPQNIDYNKPQNINNSENNMDPSFQQGSSNPLSNSMGINISNNQINNNSLANSSPGPLVYKEILLNKEYNYYLLIQIIN